jgi:hypothetical protein
MLLPKNNDPDKFQVDLNPALPSMGEALAVLSGCTLLKSMYWSRKNFWDAY